MANRSIAITLATLCGALCLLTPPVQVSSQTRSRALPSRAAVDAYILGPRSIIAGSSASYRIAVHWAKAPGNSGPLPGASVSLTLQRNKQQIALGRGTSDATGNAHFRFKVPRKAAGTYQLAVAITSPLGKRSRAAEVQVFPGGRVLLTTDKALYQPSQTIHVRALALRSMDLEPVAWRPLKIQIKDSSGNVVLNRTKKTSRFGVASVDLQLADEINLGHYTVEAWVKGAGKAGHGTRTVEVKRYVLPRFKVRIETDRGYYRPGDTVRGTVRSDYFFGKPVARGKVRLILLSDDGRGVTRHEVPSQRADAAGRFTFAVPLPRGGAVYYGGEVRILAKVRDGANQLEQADRSIPLTARPLRVSLIPQNSHLVPGLKNQVHVIAGYPDGAPARGARVSLSDGRRTFQARTDALGVATFKLRPRARSKRCQGAEEGAHQASMIITVRVKDSMGQRGTHRSCLPVAPRGSVLVMPARALIDPGQPVQVQLQTVRSRGFTSGQIFLDVVKAGQTIGTFTQTLRGGRATFRFEPDPALFGLLELRGYRVSDAGERLGTSRMVYINHPGQLVIKATADRSTYRPGDHVRLRFQVTDSRTGAGVQAALGVRAMDEAVVALGGLAQRDPRLFFTLASQVQEGPELVTRPGGRNLEHWVANPRADIDARRARAAEVLLAALRPTESQVWETNPWLERQEAWAEQAPELVSAAVDFMETHPVGRKTARGWRFDPELVPRMAAAKKIRQAQVSDPWRRIVRPWHLRQTDPRFVFGKLAPRLAREQLLQIYEAFGECWTELKLPREEVRLLRPEQRPLVLPPTLLSTLVKMGKLKRHQIIDPWGKPYGVFMDPRVYFDPYDYKLVSRHVIRSAGPDGKLGTRDDLLPRGKRLRVRPTRGGSLTAADEAALGRFIGDEIGSEAYGVGGLGLAGTGGGGGGSGEGTIGLGSMGTIGHGGGGMPARVRSLFPETLLWRPNVVTDRRGRATIDLDLADSITDWRVLATGSSLGGLLGATSMSLRAFQEFFVDVELPGALTRGDRLSVPVTVYNYLKRAQKITLQLKREPWFTPRGPLEQSITLGPSQVGVRYFSIEARRRGRGDLQVHASAVGQNGKVIKDAIRRTTEVKPDGVERVISFSGTLTSAASHDLAPLAGALAGSRRVALSITPGPMSQILSGLEGLLKMPDGCFEQTSSATYPNVLVLDYLRRTGQSNAKIEAKAKQYINRGYQRLLGFEVWGGGFSMYGKPPADPVLTAYGLMEFSDMSRVHPVDPELILRTQKWLAKQQQTNGSWRSRGAGRSRLQSLRTTAYVAGALKRSGVKGKVLNLAMAYVRRHIKEAKDAYTLALLGNLHAGDESKFAKKIRERLWKKRSSDKGLFQSPAVTLTLGAGHSGLIETNALAALAFLSTTRPPAGLEQIIDSIVAERDPDGAWHTTYATIVALRALLMADERQRSRPRGKLQVLVDGRQRTGISLKAQDAGHRVDLTPYAKSGPQRITLQYRGTGRLQYHLVDRSWSPRKHQQRAPRPRRPGFTITTKFNKVNMKRGEATWLDLEVRNLHRRRVDAPLVAVELPPGFKVDEDSLTALVSRGKVEKVQRTGNRALLYLSHLEGKGRLKETVKLRSSYPLKVQVRPSVVYEYYRPENRAESQPHILTVH